jgi:predicted Zn-dependent protease
MSRRSAAPRLILALLLAGVAFAGYQCSAQDNPITGERQKVALDFDEEIAIGLQSVPQMKAMHGGDHPDREAQAHVDRVGSRLVAALDAELAKQGRSDPYEFEFHLLRDADTINAFALPGGQVFVTFALYSKFKTEGQLAGVLAHEVGHVVERHAAQQISKGRLLEGLAGAAGVAGGDASSHRAAQQVAQLMALRYGRDDELESDSWGVRLSARAGYDPRAMIAVMDILASASQGRGEPPEFLSTHPKPANRRQYVEDLIATEFPQGLPQDLVP